MTSEHYKYATEHYVGMVTNKTTLQYLSFYADAQGVFSIELAELARNTGATEGATRASVRWLHNTGWIELQAPVFELVFGHLAVPESEQSDGNAARSIG